MLSPLLSYLIGLVGSFEYVSETKGLAYTIKKNGEKITGIYEGAELKPIAFDNYKSLAFFIQTGKVTQTSEDHPFIGSKKKLKIVYPMALILYKRGIENINCESEAQQIVSGIQKNIAGIKTTLIGSLHFDMVEINIKDTDYDKNAVYESLMAGDSKLTEKDFLAQINFEVELSGDESCFTQEPCSPNSEEKRFILYGNGTTQSYVHQLVGKTLLRLSIDNSPKNFDTTKPPYDGQFASSSGIIYWQSTVATDSIIQGTYK